MYCIDSCVYSIFIITVLLHDRYYVWDAEEFDYSMNSLFRLTTKHTPGFHIAGPCERGTSNDMWIPLTEDQSRGSVSVSWRHHDLGRCISVPPICRYKAFGAVYWPLTPCTLVHVWQNYELICMFDIVDKSFFFLMFVCMYVDGILQ